MSRTITPKGNRYIKIKLGYRYGSAGRFMGTFLLVMGTFFSLLSLPLAILLLLVGGFFASARDQILIDYEAYRFKSYVGYLGISIGQWQNMKEFVDIAILGGQETYRTYSRANQALDVTRKVIRVFLLSKSHRTKLLVGVFESLPAAQEHVQEILKYIPVNYTNYSPKISEATQLRRNRGRR